MDPNPQRNSHDSSTKSATPHAQASPSTHEPPHSSHADPATTISSSPAGPPVQTTSFRKAVPMPDPISMPTPAPTGEVASPASSSAPPSILNTHPPSNSPPPIPPSPYTPSGAIAGPSRRLTADPPQESDEDEHERAQGGASPQASSSQVLINPASPTGNGGHYGLSPHSSLRRPPQRAVSYGHSERPIRQLERYPTAPPLKSLPHTPTPGAGPGALASNPEGFQSQAFAADWNIPYYGRDGPVVGVPVSGNGSGLGIGNGMGNRRSVVLSQAGTLVQNGEKTIGERIKPTLDAAKAEKLKAELRARAHGWSLNVAIGAQVVLGALTTGVAAATSGKQTSIATSILGGMSTLAASYLAKARGSGEPEESVRRVQDLESFIRDLEAFEMDHGWKCGQEQDHMINRYRRRFEEIMGNQVEGVGDDINVKRKQKEKTNDSPV